MRSFTESKTGYSIFQLAPFQPVSGVYDVSIGQSYIPIIVCISAVYLHSILGI